MGDPVTDILNANRSGGYMEADYYGMGYPGTGGYVEEAPAAPPTTQPSSGWTTTSSRTGVGGTTGVSGSSLKTTAPAPKKPTTAEVNARATAAAQLVMSGQASSFEQAYTMIDTGGGGGSNVNQGSAYSTISPEERRRLELVGAANAAAGIGVNTPNARDYNTQAEFDAAMRAASDATGDLTLYDRTQRAYQQEPDWMATGLQPVGDGFVRDLKTNQLIYTGGGGSGGGGGGGGGGFGGGNTVQTVSGTERTYIDIPTPEEFLNDFNVAYSTFVDTLKRSGELGVVEADWLLSNSEMVFSEFIAEQGRKAEAGEDIFGLLNDPADASQVQFFANRPGDVATTTVSSTTDMISGDSELQKLYRDLAAMPSAAAKASVQTKINNRLAQLNASLPTPSTQTTTVQKNEDLYTRDKLAVGYLESPMEYLNTNKDTGKLKLMYEGRRLSRQAAASAPVGEAATKRVY